jgi:hypothetical protein
MSVGTRIALSSLLTSVAPASMQTRRSFFHIAQFPLDRDVRADGIEIGPSVGIAVIVARREKPINVTGSGRAVSASAKPEKRSVVSQRCIAIVRPSTSLRSAQGEVIIGWH